MGPCFISTEGDSHPLFRDQYHRLQWGRASSGRKALTDSHEELIAHFASMGPCFISTEGAIAVAARAADSGCFNGAVLHQHGRHWIGRGSRITIQALQWGRASSARKARNSFVELNITWASMGPCFISTEGHRLSR